MTSDTVDLDNVREFVLDLADHCAAAGRAAMHIVPREQIVHVQYDELVRDPAAMAISVYERLGYSTDAALRARMQQWLADNPSDKNGRHNYAMEDFGLTPEIISDRLAVPPVRNAAGE